MKVVHVTQSYYPRPGGVTEHVHHVACELRRRGHDVTIVTSHAGDDNDQHPGVIRLGRNVLVPMNGAWVNATVGWNLHRDLSRIFETIQPDIIHTHCPLAPTLPLMTLTAAPPGARVVGTFHEAATRNLAYELFRGPLGRFVTRLDTRIAVSEAARAFASQYFPGDYKVVPNGIDCDRFSPRHQPLAELVDDAFNILFVGRMDRRKGLKYLFRAVALASERTSRRLRLIVVGDDDLRRHLLPKLPANVSLVYAGVVTRTMLPRFYASGDVFCSPATGRESFGIVLLEAMASGLPLVGTAISGYLTVLRHERNALVVPPKDPQALCAAILRLLDDESLRRRLSVNGLEFAKVYRWQRVVDQLLAVYRQDDADSGWLSGKYLAEDSVAARAQEA
jgi:phosphatidylinositol alpha-mannosyltransferase